MQRWVTSLLLGLLSACGTPADYPEASIHSAAPHPTSAPEPEGPSPTNERRSARPQLLVTVVYDQLGSDTLQRLLPVLSSEGALKTAITRGAYFHSSVFPFVNTLTAPGHAAIFTGTPPSASGISGNEDFSLEHGRVATAFSAGHFVIGNPSSQIGASRLRTQTLGAALKAAIPAAKVASLSLKDRSAVFSAGAQVEVVVWYDATISAFTSSTYYTATLPKWLVEFQASQPIVQLLQPWHPRSPELYEKLLGPDRAPGESMWWDNGFPHDPRSAPSPAAALRLQPELSEYLVALAERTVHELEMGADDDPDLLMISISGTDYAGHDFGPHSWEYADHLLRADLAVGQFLARLESERSISVMLTSDHGVAPLPEHAAAMGHVTKPQRLSEPRMLEVVEAQLDQAFGAFDWFAAQLSPFVYFTDAARQRPDFTAVKQRARQLYADLDGVEQVYTNDQARGFVDAADPEQRMLANSFAFGTSADLLLLTKPYVIFGFGPKGSGGTHHGTHHTYDREVPLLFFGQGVGHFEQPQPVSQLQVAPTLARLLAVPAPRDARDTALDLTSRPATR